MTDWKFYDVWVDGYGTAVMTGSSPGTVRAKAWRCDAFNHITFGQFMRMCRVRRRIDPPADDGYGYVRQNYGVDPKIGQRVTACGKSGVVVYPGSSTAHVHVVFDGRDHDTPVHPSDISPDPSPVGVCTEKEERR